MCNRWLSRPVVALLVSAGLLNSCGDGVSDTDFSKDRHPDNYEAWRANAGLLRRKTAGPQKWPYVRPLRALLQPSSRPEGLLFKTAAQASGVSVLSLFFPGLRGCPCFL